MELENAKLFYDSGMDREAIKEFNKGFDTLPLSLVGYSPSKEVPAEITVCDHSSEAEKKYNIRVGDCCRIAIKGLENLTDVASLESVISGNNPATGIKTSEATYIFGL